MSKRSTFIAALIVACFGCAADTKHHPKQDGELGKLSLYLVGSDSHGQQYRLRNAEFDVAAYYYYYNSTPNPFRTTLSSEDDLDAQFIETELVPGEYSVSLGNNLWYLERLTDEGPQRVEQAVLLSSSYQYAYIYDHGTTDVYFTFGVDGELIDFRHGNLRIGISVELPDDDGGVGVTDGGVTFPNPDQDAGAP